MDDHVCCILGVCCPPLAVSRRRALAHELVADGVCASERDAMKVATWTLNHFDVAPAGTLTPLIAAVAGMATKAASKKR